MKLFYFFIFLLTLTLVPIATAIYGGDNATLFNQECVGDINVTVSATLPIDDNEFELTDCTKQSMVSWTCPCPSVELSLSLNTINEYTFNLLYYVPGSSSGSSGGHRSSRRTVIIFPTENVTEPEHNGFVLPDVSSLHPKPEPDQEQPTPPTEIIEINETVPINESIPINESSINDNDEPKKDYRRIVLFVFLLFLLFGFVMVLYLESKRKVEIK